MSYFHLFAIRKPWIDRWKGSPRAFSPFGTYNYCRQFVWGKLEQQAAMISGILTRKPWAVRSIVIRRDRNG